MADGMKRAFAFARATREHRPCANCKATKYGHVDHAHAALTTQHGRCPFGDCGKYAPAPTPEEKP